MDVRNETLYVLSHICVSMCTVTIGCLDHKYIFMQMCAVLYIDVYKYIGMFLSTTYNVVIQVLTLSPLVGTFPGRINYRSERLLLSRYRFIYITQGGHIS